MDNKINQAIIVSALAASLAGQPVEAALAASSSTTEANPAGSPAEFHGPDKGIATPDFVASWEHTLDILQAPRLYVGQDHGAVCGAFLTEDEAGNLFINLTPHTLGTDSDQYLYIDTGAIMPMKISIKEIVHDYVKSRVDEQDSDFLMKQANDLPVAVPLDKLPAEQIAQLKSSGVPIFDYNPELLGKFHLPYTNPLIRNVVLVSPNIYDGQDFITFQTQINFGAAQPTVAPGYSWPRNDDNLATQIAIYPIGKIDKQGSDTLVLDKTTAVFPGQSGVELMYAVQLDDGKYYILTNLQGQPYVAGTFTGIFNEIPDLKITRADLRNDAIDAGRIGAQGYSGAAYNVPTASMDGKVIFLADPAVGNWASRL